MYIILVLLQTVVLPIVSAVIELIVAPGSEPVAVFGRWFLFWGVGIRLLVAGVSQVLRPGFTIQNILGEKNEGAEHIAQELGFANVAIGVAATASLFISGWVVPLALVGALFLGLAAIRHLFKKGRNVKENVATFTDLLVAVVLAVFLVWTLVNG